MTETTQNGTESRARRILREAVSIGLILLTVLAARSSLADHYVVPSGSMEPTLVPGDRVFVDKRAYGLRFPFTRWQLVDGEPVTRGDVVIFDSPTSGKRLIKRIVAVGGDSVRIEDGRLSINGKSMAVDPESGGRSPAVELFGDKRVRLSLDVGGGPDYVAVVPDGALLAVGDHRGDSLDGRSFGFIGERDVYAKAIAIYWRSDDGFVWRHL